MKLFRANDWLNSLIAEEEFISDPHFLHKTISLHLIIHRFRRANRYTTKLMDTQIYK